MGLKLLFLFYLHLSFFSSSWAKVEYSDSQVMVTTGVKSWVEEFSQRVEDLEEDKKYPENGLTECRETKEIKRTILCLSYMQEDMNYNLARASFFVEGLADWPTGEVINHSHRYLLRYSPMIGGHDLKLTDLLRFYQRVDEVCEETQSEDYCLSSHEKEMYNNLITLLSEENEEAVVITFAVHSTLHYYEVVSHEVLHAQYFLDPAYRSVIDEYWENDVSEQDKNLARRSLERYYNVHEDELLLKNEFQAYVLMANAEDNLLWFFLNSHRGPLLDKLKAKGAEPIQVQ